MGRDKRVCCAGDKRKEDIEEYPLYSFFLFFQGIENEDCSRNH